MLVLFACSNLIFIIWLGRDWQNLLIIPELSVQLKLDGWCDLLSRKGQLLGRSSLVPVSGIKPAGTSSESGLTRGNYSLLLQLTNDRARLCLCQCVSSSQSEAKWFKLQCRDRQTLRSEFQTSVRSILDPNLGIQNMKWFAYWTVSVNVSGAGWYLIILYQMLDRILDTDSPTIIYLYNICWSIIHILCHI